MTNGESIPTPSTHELKVLLSAEGNYGAIEDELTYTALGMYDDDDYVGIAKICLDLGGIKEVAKAEARLNHIEGFDRRKPTIIAQNSGLIYIRRIAIGELLSTLTYEQHAQFVRVMNDETELLEAEEVDAYRATETE